MAKGNTGGMKPPAVSLARRFGAGDPYVASPETQPRESAMRDAQRGKMTHDALKKSQSTGLTPP